MTGIDLDYVEARPKRWWQHRLLHRLVIFIACGWLAWYLWGLAVPAFHRCQNLRLEKKAAEYPTGPQLASLSYTLPATSVQTVSPQFAIFDAALRTSRTNAGMGSVTAPGLLTNPVFCHALTSLSGTKRIVQVYATITPGSFAHPLQINLLATSWPIHDLSWVWASSARTGNFPAEIPDIASAHLNFTVSSKISLTSGAIEPKDPSVIIINYRVDQHSYLLRIHLVDDTTSPFPRMAVEMIPDIVKLPGSNGYGMVGFYLWPIAAKPSAK